MTLIEKINNNAELQKEVLLVQLANKRINRTFKICALFFTALSIIGTFAVNELIECNKNIAEVQQEITNSNYKPVNK